MAISQPAEGLSSSTSASLLSTVQAYSALTKALFQSIENPSSKLPTITDVHAEKSWSPNTSGDLLRAISEVDRLLSSRIETARIHVENQSRIQELKAHAKRRDRITRGAIAQLDEMGNQLDQIVRLGQSQVDSISKAQSSPLPYDTILSYSQKLSRYTSAPPGFNLQPPALPADKTDEMPLGPDYNQSAERAAAYYDPTMPSMPQEMPFPSDALMRQGILNTQDMLAGAPMAEEPENETMPEPDFIPTYSQLHAQQQQQRQEEEEEAFDLDLN